MAENIGVRTGPGKLAREFHATSDTDRSMVPVMRRVLPFLPLILFALAMIWLSRSVGWADLALHQDALLHWVAVHPLLAAGSFVLAYVATAALSLPHGALMTVTGGLLFGPVAGAILAVTGATIGASILLIVLRNVLAGTLQRQRDRIPAAMRLRLARDGSSYLLALRLLPVFPFWLVNLAAAIVGIRLAAFIPATLFGCLPVTFILSWVGSGIGDVLAQGRTPDLTLLFTPGLLLPLVALAILSLLPVLLRRRPAHA